MKIEIDNFGNRFTCRGDFRYYLLPDGRVMREHYYITRDKGGREWRTPLRRSVKGAFPDAVRQALSLIGPTN
jgi:hypothetical protein